MAAFHRGFFTFLAQFWTDIRYSQVEPSEDKQDAKEDDENGYYFAELLPEFIGKNISRKRYGQHHRYSSYAKKHHI